jgi:hypothetical protein
MERVNDTMSHTSYKDELVESYKQVSRRLGMTSEPNFVKRPRVKDPMKNVVVEFKGPRPRFYRTGKQKIVDEILAKHKLEWNEVFNDKRYRRPSLIRNEIWWTLKQAGMTYNQIGRICRPDMPYDHSTVLHGVKRHQRLVDAKNAPDPQDDQSDW